MRTILVVEDQAVMRDLYGLELEHEGYSVLKAASGSEALEIVRRSEPDVVILDIRLNQENGLDYLPQMLEIRPSLPVIVNSAYPFYRDDFTSWLAVAYIVKSTDTTELMRRVHEVLEESDHLSKVH